MAFDGFPGAACGDAHLLVVITGRAAGGEGVIKPEILFLAQRVGGVGEGGRALVGGNHEIGVVDVVANGVGRRDNGIANNVVGDRQQSADEQLVGVTSGFKDRIATAISRQFLGIEATLGAHRHDHGILHLLRLDQSEHFGAVILGTIRPAQPAAGDGAEAQMHPFDFRTIDENLTEGAWLRQAFELLGIQFECQCRPRRAVGTGLKVVGSERGFDRIDVSSEDAVIIKAGDFSQCSFDCFNYTRTLFRALGSLEPEVKPDPEQIVQLGGNRRVAVEAVGNIFLGIGNPGLAQIARIGTQNSCFTNRQTGICDQTVVAVIVGVAAPDRQEGLLQPCPIDGQINGALVLVDDLHVVQDHGIGNTSLAIKKNLVGLLADDLETEIFEQRNTARQGHRFAEMENLQGQVISGCVVAAIERDLDSTGFLAGDDGVEISQGLFGPEPFLVGLADADALGLAAAEHPELVFPAGDDRADVAFELILRNLRRLAFRAADDEVHTGDAAFGEGRVVSRHTAIIDRLEVVADAFPGDRIILIARDIDDQRDEAVKAVDAGQNPDPRTIRELVDLHAEPRQKICIDLKQIVARVGFQRVEQKFAGMALRVEAEFGDHRLHLRAQQRDLGDRAGVGGGGEEPDNAQFADNLAFRIETLDADIVHIGAAVDDRTHIGLGDDQKIRALQKIKNFRRGGDLVLAQPQHQHVRV